MNEHEWRALRAAGRQAEHQAAKILDRPLRPWELRTWQETWRVWAVQVLSRESGTRSTLHPCGRWTPSRPVN
jgi:hypothetical protein